MFKRLRKDVDYAIERTRANEERLNEQSERVGAIIDRFNEVIDYVLDAKCPMCGEKMEFSFKTPRDIYERRCANVARLKCQNDGFEISCNSLKGCVDKLREIERKVKGKEKSE